MIKFGTGGWRTIIGENFTKRNLQILALAISMKMEKEQVSAEGIVIGYDRRFLSKEAVFWMSEIFAKQGITVYFIDRSSPTPLVMYYTMKHRLHYGLMVTASHNPAIFNGVKVFTYGGRDADEKTTEEIEHYIEKAEEKYLWDETDCGKNPPDLYLKALDEGKVIIVHPMNEYVDEIIQMVDIDAIRMADLRVAIDPMYGVSLTALSTILSIARCQVETINYQHDTLFGGKMPAPTEKTLRNLRTYVIDRGLDIGIATDGDADRLGVIDEKGKNLHANDILVILYYYLLKIKGWRGPAVRNIATTHRLDAVAKAFGQKCYEVPVGFKYISAKMAEVGAIIGGESSGGLTVKGHIRGKDGIYAAMLLIEMLAVSGKKLSEIEDEIEEEFGRSSMVEHNCRFQFEKKSKIQEMIFVNKKLPDFAQAIDHVSYLDGCKIYFSNGGWLVARFSGTESLLRIFCEMSSIEECRNACHTMESFLGIEPESIS